jgi:hypothetical protein
MLPHARPLSGPRLQANAHAFSRSVLPVTYEPARCAVVNRARRTSGENSSRLLTTPLLAAYIGVGE